MRVQGDTRWSFADAAKTRPANTTAYAANKTLGDATTSLFKFGGLFNDTDRSFWLTEARLEVSKAAITIPTGIALRAYFFNTAITDPGPDQSAYSMLTANRASRLGAVDLTQTLTGDGSSDAYEVFGVPYGGPLLLRAAAQGANDLWMLLVATAGFTPASAAVLTPSIRGALDA